MISSSKSGSSSGRSILDKPLKDKQKNEVSVSAFGYLYCAIFDYCKGRSSNRSEISSRYGI